MMRPGGRNRYWWLRVRNISLQWWVVGCSVCRRDRISRQQLRFVGRISYNHVRLWLHSQNMRAGILLLTTFLMEKRNCRKWSQRGRGVPPPEYQWWPVICYRVSLSSLLLFQFVGPHKLSILILQNWFANRLSKIG